MKIEKILYFGKPLYWFRCTGSGLFCIEKTLCAMISGGIFEAAGIGFGQTAGRDFTKMLIKDYGKKWGNRFSYGIAEVIKGSGWEGLDWLYSSYFESDEDY